MSLSDSAYIYVNSTDSFYLEHTVVVETTYNTDSPESTSTVTVCHVGNVSSSCRLAPFNKTLFEVIGSLGQLRYIPTGDIVQAGEYFRGQNGTIHVCEFLPQNGTVGKNNTRHLFQYSTVQVYLSYICVPISMLALMVTFITYCTFPVLRKLMSSKLVMALCFTLFFAQLLLLTGGMAVPSPEACALVAILSHFLWLSVFFISTTLAIDLAKTFGNQDTIYLSTNSAKALCCYFGGALGLSAAVVLTCVVLTYAKGYDLHMQYGGGSSCWIGSGTMNLFAFGVPVAIALLLNGFLFIRTVRGLMENEKISGRLREKSHSAGNRKQLRIYVRISTLMGFTWILGYIAAFAGVSVLWYIFIILNSLQGTYIFLAFVVNRRVYWLWRESFERRRAAASTTFERMPMRSKGSKNTASTALSHSSKADDNRT
ncbi:adhesion G protein-coupled receptor E2-like [Diadema setosum]|uniref:adhesion G protein-coupled receptor E2-like n=1 Tax=Diadema setosum TaxID=31175 RepID=UPI003B3A1962